MNRSLILSLMAMAAVMACHGRQLTPGEAMARAGLLPASRSQASPELCYTATDSLSRPMAYVFAAGDGQGYTVVSADDVAVPVLGYSDSGTFDAGSIPDNMRWWLEGYAREIAWAADHGVAAAPASRAADTRQPIAPLLKTRWDQNSPYSDKCPEYASGYHCPTGCVATAMAQVIKYHNYPERGTGSVSYRTASGYNVAFDFASTPLPMSLMADVYDVTSSAESRDAVATLMLACGASVTMEYQSSASGASSASVPDALMSYFGYDSNSVAYRQRAWYGLKEWEDLIYNDLATVGPVYYGGNNMSSGHAFVCDGYSSDGYFHFNWGWSGMADGYFRLTALDPATQGIGGSAAGYNWYQCVVTGVQPPKPDSDRALIMIVGGDGFKASAASASKGSTMRFTGSMVNRSRFDMTGFSLGVRYERVDGTGAPVYVMASQSPSSLAAGRSVEGLEAEVPQSLSDGEYRVAPVFSAFGGGWQDMLSENQCVSRTAMATVSGSAVTFSTVAPALSITGVTPLSPIYQRRSFMIGGHAVNNGNGEFHSTLCGAFLNQSGYPVAMGEVFYVDLQPGESMDLEYYTMVIREDPSAFRAGTFRFAFIDYDTFYNTLEQQVVMYGTPVEMTVKEAVAYGTLSLVSMEVENADAVDASDVRVNATVKGETDFYSDYLQLFVNNDMGWFRSENPVFVEAGQTATVRFRFSLPDAEPGKTYRAILYRYPFDGTSVVGRRVDFTIDDKSGIAEITASGTPGQVEYFNLQGMPVSAGDLRPGHVYIRRQGGDVAKIRL